MNKEKQRENEKAERYETVGVRRRRTGEKQVNDNLKTKGNKTKHYKKI